MSVNLCVCVYLCAYLDFCFCVPIWDCGNCLCVCVSVRARARAYVFARAFYVTTKYMCVCVRAHTLMFAGVTSTYV